MSGIGKESGKAFDFAQVNYLRPLEPTAGPKFTLVGYGLESGKMDLAPDAMPKFAQVRFPADLDLEVETIPGRQGLRAVVIGFTVPAAAAVPKAA